MYKKEKGITMVALAVTIVVLLIIASISIATVMGDNGVIQKAKEAREGSKIDDLEETIYLKYNETCNENREFESKVLEEKLKQALQDNNVKVIEEEDKIIVEAKGYEIIIDKDSGNIVDGEIAKVTWPRVETKKTQTNGDPIDEDEIYEELQIIVNVTNKEEFDKYEITMKDENGNNIEKAETAEGDAGFIVPATGKYIVYVKGTKDGYEKTTEKTIILKQTSETDKEYQVKYDANGGTGAPEQTVKIEGTNLILSDKIPTRTGYTFEGWATSKTATTAEYQPKGEYKQDSSVTLYAVWTANKYTITLEGQGATTTETTEIYIKYATGIYQDKNLTQEITQTSNAIISPKREYTVTFNNNNGTENTSEKSTYTFDGYYSEATAGTQMIGANGYITNNLTNTTYTSNAKLYARWISETAKVTLPTPIKDGYTFAGWYKEEACTNKVGNADESYIATGDITLYAKWTANNYTITYDNNNYLFGLDNVSNVQADAMTYSISNKVVTVTGNTDDGWGYTNGRVYLEGGKTYVFSCTTSGTWSAGYGDGSVQAFLVQAGSVSTEWLHMENNTGYEFIPKNSGIYYLRLDVNKNGATHTFSNIKITEKGSSATKTYGNTLGTLPTPSRPFYTFKGWFTAASGGTQVTSSTAVPAGNTTYYAQWTELGDTAKIENITHTGYDVYIKTSSTTLSAVRVPTWTNYNGQDDLGTWTSGSKYLATKISPYCYYYRVNVSDHNYESGAYISHVYTYNSAGTGTCTANLSATVPANPDTTAPNISAYAGTMLYTDPAFASGTNSIGVYNNSGNGTVTHTRKAMSDNPEGSGYGIEIKTTGTASPGHGGFTFYTSTAANKEFITRIVAKIPLGYTINWASNAYGSTGAAAQWLTSQAGTGTWQEYAFRVKCGSDGSFSTSNYFYLNGGSTATTSAPITWQLGYATVIDTTKWSTQNYVITVGTDSGSGVVGYGLNESSTTQPTFTIKTANANVVKISGAITTNKTYYSWIRDAAGNVVNKDVAVNRVDRTAPTMGTPTAAASSATTFKVTVPSVEDTGGSGLKGYYASTSSTTPTVTSVTWTSNTASSFSFTGNENTTYYIWVLDNAGNVSASKSIKTPELNFSVNNTSWYTTLEQAINACAASESTIYVLNDVEDDSTASISKNLTLNTNGKTLKRKAIIKINSGYKVTVNGSGTIATTAAVRTLDNYGTLYVTNLTVSKTNTGAVISTNSGAKTYIQTGASLSQTVNPVLNTVAGGTSYIQGGTLTSNSASGDSAQVTVNRGTTYLSAGTLESKGTSSAFGNHEGKAQLIMTGGTIKSTAQGLYNGSSDGKIARAFIKGGTITSSASDKAALINYSTTYSWPSSGTYICNSSVACTVHIEGNAKISNTGSYYAVANRDTGKIHTTKEYTGYIHAKNNYVLYSSSSDYIITLFGGTLYAQKGSSYYSKGSAVNIRDTVAKKTTAPPN